jgi:lipopolysaccharide/colanic/teichoic acid biosynthesis glycosyltransferase
MRTLNLALKRFFDILCSAVALVVASPFILLIAVLVKTSSKGPIFFLQERLGRNGKAFKIIKFRTMVVNAEKIGTGVKIDGKGDPRITKVGRFLRATSMDELPQLVNVLKGDMALVGPRPPVTYHPYNGYESYPEWAKPRFQMRPGMTGLVQISTRSKTSWDDRIRIDLEYIEKFNILFDIRILFGTIKTVFDGLKE